MTARFENRTVVITGASMGVGAATAHAFAREGAKLVLVARGKEALGKIAAELSNRAEVMAVAMDVSDRRGCRELLEHVLTRFGRIDVLVNNAGYHKRGPVTTLDPDDMARMVEVNLTAPLYLTRLALPYFDEAGGGAVVNVASLAGMTPVPGAATYSGTKFGLRGFSYALAEEVRDRNITVSLVSPGPINTGFIMDEIDQVEDITFSQPMSTAEQVADAILDAAAAGKSVEIAMPRASGWLATVAYLFPPLARRLRPMLRRKGAKAKAKYRAERKSG